MQSVEISAAAADSSSLPVNGVWRTILSYIFWQHERGTLHYDIMVTLILIFVFFSPRVINFNDKPETLNRHPTSVVVTSDGANGLIYEIKASEIKASGISAGDDAAIRQQLLQTIQPVSGDVAIVKYEAVSDGKGHVEDYRVWVKRKP